MCLHGVCVCAYVSACLYVSRCVCMSSLEQTTEPVISGTA